jgi:squalene-hopene/tetraprenyl-beta-curcumene cyclase
VTDRVASARLASTLKSLTGALVAELNPAGFWSGELSSSALSTAVAVIALHWMGDETLIARGLQWLASNANPDGGWGDTIRSRSNLSTTALVWAAFGAANQDRNFPETIAKAKAWLWREAGSRENLPAAILARYGKDRTFSVPILMTLAISGRFEATGWRTIIPLPFELAVLPQSWFGALQLPVVSYALPALIAIGQTIHHHAPSSNPIARFVRTICKERTLQRLTTLQPANGGFLEATPLTAFVTMSLASMGRQDHPVAIKGAAFLRNSVRADGSWPIDTNLATWVTTLAVKALAHQPRALSPKQKTSVLNWLLKQQYRVAHPYTGAAPGGWAWTDLPGGVPDADDTAGALIAIRHLSEPNAVTIDAAEKGITWLLNLQNRDGGFPTFCRGWGTLPFDHSAPELTAHALHAWTNWRNHINPILRRKIDAARQKALRYLQKSQRPDGAWIPLWFGNEHAANHENPIYGTARTLISLHECDDTDATSNIVSRAENFLGAATNKTGGWGGDSLSPESIEETSVAVEALRDLRAANRLIDLIERGDTAAPIGLYFARLWYYERLYPIIFATSALGSLASKQL